MSILDQKGQLLSDAFSPDSPEGLASRELEMRSEIEKYLEAKAEQIVTQIVGVGNARVQISAEINHDRVERTVEMVDPERQVLASEQRSEIIPGAQGGAGSTNVSANYLNSRTVETYSGAVGNVRRITAAVLVNDRFDPNAAPGAQAQPRTPEELARIQALVQSAIGLDADRGDVISVVSVPFDVPLPEVDEGMDLMMIVSEGWKPAIWILGLIFCFIIGLRVVRAIQQPPVEAVVAALPAPDEETLPELAPGEEPEEDALTPTEALIAQIMPPIDNSPTPGQALREQVVMRLDQQPETSLRLIRSWLKDS